MIKNIDDIPVFENKVWLSSPTMHGEEQKWVDEAIRTNWVSTVGENINEVERICAETIGVKYGVGLSAGTAALHLGIRLLGESLYGKAPVGHGTLAGKKVFATDMTFDATVNPIAYEGGEIVFIDSETDTWNMDPKALEKAFEMYPEVRLIVVAHLYGTPGNMDEIMRIAREHNALVLEDAAESFLGEYDGKQTGAFGDISIISFNGNKLITGSAGGMLLTDNKEWADLARKWSTQSRENAAWYQHEDLGYNYRMSNIIAGVVRGQLPYAAEHMQQKKAVYERYAQGFKDLPVRMNPIGDDRISPNYWLSCITVNPEAMCPQVRGERDVLFVPEKGKSCPTEILDAIMSKNAEGRPIWKPMHMQPIFRMNPFFTAEGSGRGRTNAYNRDMTLSVADEDIFQRGLCLPSDNKMTQKEQDGVIEIVKRCFA